MITTNTLKAIPIQPEPKTPGTWILKKPSTMVTT